MRNAILNNLTGSLPLSPEKDVLVYKDAEWEV